MQKYYIFLKKIIHFIGTTTPIPRELNPLPAMDRKGGTSIKGSKCISSRTMLHELASQNLFSPLEQIMLNSFHGKSVFYISTPSLPPSPGDTATSRQSGSVWRACCCPLGCSPCPPCHCSSHCSCILHSTLLSTWLCVLAAERSSRSLQGCTGVWAPLAATTSGTDSPLQWACPFTGRKGKVLELIPPIQKN